MRHAHPLSYIRISIIWLIIGMMIELSSSWIMAATYPTIAIGWVASARWSLYTRFVDLLEDTDVATTTGRVKDSEKLGWVLASAHQRRVTGTCTVDSPIVKIASDGTVTCGSLYHWVAPTIWGSCIPGSIPGSGTQVGTVTCVDHKNRTFPDTKCIAAVPALVKPSDTQTCTPSGPPPPPPATPLGSVPTGYGGCSPIGSAYTDFQVWWSACIARWCDFGIEYRFDTATGIGTQDSATACSTDKTVKYQYIWNVTTLKWEMSSTISVSGGLPRTCAAAC
jgi:hypothetical protein